MQNERPALFIPLHEGQQRAKDIAVVAVFTGTNDDTVIITIAHEFLIVMNDVSTVIFPSLPAAITPVIFCAAIMDAKEACRSPSFQMLCGWT
jgi:hypothetical protein